MKSLHLLYHELRPGGSRYSYVTSCEEFEAHCALFARLQQHKLPHGFLHPEITFDDGHSSDEDYAMPVLEKFRLKATFFVTAGWTGTRAGFMSTAQLRSLRDAGHQVGAHGMTHKLLTTCSADELRIELRGAKERLEDGLGQSIKCMSLPGGRHNNRVLQACADAGYEQVFTSVPRPEQMNTRPHTVGRLNLHSKATSAWLEDVLRPETGTLARLQRADRLKAMAKTVLGDALYRKLWAVANREEAETDAGVLTP